MLIHIEDDVQSMPEPYNFESNPYRPLPVIPANKTALYSQFTANTVATAVGINSYNIVNHPMYNLTIRIKNDTFMARLSKPKWWMDGRFSHIPNKITCKV